MNGLDWRHTVLFNIEVFQFTEVAFLLEVGMDSLDSQGDLRGYKLATWVLSIEMK